MPRSVLAALAALALCAPAASAYRLPEGLAPIPGSPAERFTGLALDPPEYDPATHCAPAPHKGVMAAVRWLERHARGVSWGTYRCERWGKGSASLHAENRAIDWHPADRAAAGELIELLLAPDSAGNPQALARRMGVEELIWDCSYWGAGAEQFSRYQYCYGKDGQRRKRIDPTAGHLDHVHIGFSLRGARAQTSFWRIALRRR